MKKLKDFQIDTFDGGGYFTFFTKAEDHKNALEHLQINSSDFRNIVHSDRDLTIKIKRLKNIKRGKVKKDRDIKR